jgi:uncharacterized protein involved in type VI secretion and phage assembly
MRAGYAFSLSGKSYQLLTVRHLCNCCKDNNDLLNASQACDLGFTIDLGTKGYSNSFTCHPLELGAFAPEISVPRPVVNGLVHAVICSSTETAGYAFLDAKGRYQVQFPFAKAVYDSHNVPVTGESGVPVPLRMAQINAGTKDAVHSGVHFPLLKDTEVLVAFTDGDPDRPVIIAALPNQTNTSVVTDTNNKQNVIKTPQGHTLTMDDNVDAPKITLESKGGHTVTMDDKEDKQKITLTSSGGHRVMMDDATSAPTITLTSTGGHTVTMDDTTSAPKITLTSKGGHILSMDDTKGAKEMTLTSSDKKMAVKMDEKEKKLVWNYGANSQSLTSAKAIELIVTHKESTIAGNVFSTVLGASESINIGGKANIACGLNETLNLLHNLTVNIGLNNSVNLGNNSSANLGPTIAVKTSEANVSMVKSESALQVTNLLMQMFII